MIDLRDYQQDCVDAIDNMQSGSGLVSMATGLGKTVVFSRIRRKGKVLIISHREELVHQPIKYYDCPCGVEQGEETSHGEQVISASVQSLNHRLEKFSPDEFDMIITDEAHHAAAPSYRRIYEYFHPRLHIGFTATPNRGDKVRLDDIFDSIIFQRDLKWGIKQGWLTNVRCLRAKVSYDLRSVKRRMGDFVVNDLDKAVNTTMANREIADVYNKYAVGQTLIFAASVSHAQNIAAVIPGAVAVSQSTKNRKQIIEDFTARKIPCIVNCMVFTEGTDMPLIESIIIARPTQNPSLYAQMVGRGLRQYKGKEFLTLIDCVGVTDKLDICTAPSLMGLDIGDVPEFRKDKLEGMLTQMSEIVEDAKDCPESWILNVQAVKLFAEEQGINVHRINWTKKSNGDLVYQFSCGDRIGVKAMDEVGMSKVMRYFYDDSQGKFTYWETPQKPLQQALDDAFTIFDTLYKEEENFWNLDSQLEWQLGSATEKQKKFIQSRMPKAEWERFMQNRVLMKGDAVQIINMLQIRNLKPQDLLYMRRRAEENRKEREQELEARQRLKIRYQFDKEKRNRKVYAIKHPTDLIITNSWEAAQMYYEQLNGKEGKKCYCKSFFTVEEARDFLRS